MIIANGISNHCKYLESSLEELITDYWINLSKEDFPMFAMLFFVFIRGELLKYLRMIYFPEFQFNLGKIPAEHLYIGIEFAIEIFWANRFCLLYACYEYNHHIFRSFYQLSTFVCTHICRVHSPSVDFNETIPVSSTIPFPIPV